MTSFILICETKMPLPMQDVILKEASPPCVELGQSARFRGIDIDVAAVLSLPLVVMDRAPSVRLPLRFRQTISQVPNARCQMA